jgi:chromosome condensin MukBEF MukE localization factor
MREYEIDWTDKIKKLEADDKAGYPPNCKEGYVAKDGKCVPIEENEAKKDKKENPFKKKDKSDKKEDDSEKKDDSKKKKPSWASIGELAIEVITP